MDSNFNRYAQLRQELRFWQKKKDKAQVMIDRFLAKLKELDEKLTHGR